jgi:hypothetical protein
MFSKLLGATGNTDNVESLTFYGPHETFDLTLELYVDNLDGSVLLDKRDGDWYSREDYGKILSGAIEGDVIVASLNNLVKCFLDLTKDL